MRPKSNLVRLPEIATLTWDDCRLLVESVVDYAIFMLDPHGYVATWNIGAERIKGYTASEIVGAHFSKFYPAEDLAEGKPDRQLSIAQEDGRFEDESWRVRKDGSRFWANVVITALRDENGKLRGFGKVTRDLTERRRAERAAAASERARFESELASRAKDEFLATVSHELRTPLTAIVGWSSMLRQRALDPTVSRPIEIIHRNAQAQVKIIEDILDVSRVINGKMRIEPRAIDLLAVTREAVEVVRPSAEAKRMSIDLRSEAETFAFVGDPERLQQVIWNLLSNAVKFTAPGGAIRISLDRVDSTAVLSVTDSGDGIEPSFLPFVFDRFRQADASTTRRVFGLGLGLALVRHIVELHGGRAEVESRGLGKGSTFVIRLPIRAVVPEQPDAPRPRGAPLEGVRVLVVDDEHDARELVAEVLAAHGAIVETAGSASAGLQSVRTFSPDVLVSDLGMPEEDGYSFIANVRALPAGDRMPAIALSAFAGPEDRARAIAAGYTTHIAKPVDAAVLAGAVASLVGSARRA